jgi:hypothetical protein
MLHRAAMRGIPGASVLFESHSGRFAVVVLETGSESHSYPYGVVCQREADGWVEMAGSNSPAWYPTTDGAGVIVFWHEDGSRAPVVEFDGARHAAESRGGYILAALWGVPDPANGPDRSWPHVA